MKINEKIIEEVKKESEKCFLPVPRVAMAGVMLGGAIAILTESVKN